MADSDSDDGATALPSPRTIQIHEDIYRRIIPDWVVNDERAPGTKRLSSAAFRPLRDSPCSGYVAAECTYQDVLGPCPTCGVGAISVKALQDKNCAVQRDIVPGEHPSHVHLIQPSGLPKSKRHDLWTELAKATRWVFGETVWGAAGESGSADK